MTGLYAQTSGFAGRHAILVRSENGLIENNLIVGTGGAAIELSNDFGFFYEGPVARNVIIRHNTIRDCHGTPIVVGSDTGKTPTRQARNIRIADNLIEAEEGPAIRITNAQDIGPPGQWTLPTGILWKF
jgi:hypothetical protein